MKIGIVTQPLLGNYGGILQNYALQQVLRQLGHDPITLDFQRGHSGILNYLRGEIRAIASFVIRPKKEKKIILPYAPNRRSAICNEFIDAHITKSHMFWDKYRSELISQYGLDAIIVGSDQVWRRGRKQLTPIYNMYLDFSKAKDIKRIAYAASFGTTDWEYSSSETEKCKRLIDQFDAISVREYSAIEMVNQYFGREATEVLDPTLLLGREGFDEILTKENSCTENYIGAYILDNSPMLENLVDDIRIKKNLDKRIKFSEFTERIGPKEFVQIISKSKFFITDSFHGTVFCILYHVPFITCVNHKRGATRFTSLLEPLGLSNRLLDTSSLDTAMEIADAPINWSKTEELLEQRRRESKNFLVKHVCI